MASTSKKSLAFLSPSSRASRRVAGDYSFMSEVLDKLLGT